MEGRCPRQEILQECLTAFDEVIDEYLDTHDLRDSGHVVCAEMAIADAMLFLAVSSWLEYTTLSPADQVGFGIRLRRILLDFVKEHVEDRDLLPLLEREIAFDE